MDGLLVARDAGADHSPVECCGEPAPAGTQAERKLLAGCRAGDLESFATLYELHHAQVFRHAFHLLGHREDADDIRQETFLRAWRALPTFRGDCSVRTFLLRICTNLCRDHARQRRSRNEVDLECCGEGTAAHSASGLSAGFEQVETAAVLAQALAQLSSRQREIIVLRDLEHLSITETAAVVGCSPASVGVKLFRARLKLKDHLKRLLR